MLITPKHTVEEALGEVKNQLSRSVADKHHKMRYFAVSTIDVETNSESSRMVVFRKLIDQWTIRFYTDSRSSKISELNLNPKCSLLFWDSRKSLQIRIQAKALIHHQDQTAEKEWENVQGNAVKSYSSVIAPGTIIETPHNAHNWHENPDHTFFSVVDCVPYNIRALQLNRDEHLSLSFTRESPDKPWVGEWVAP